MDWFIFFRGMSISGSLRSRVSVLHSSGKVRKNQRLKIQKIARLREKRESRKSKQRVRY